MMAKRTVIEDSDDDDECPGGYEDGNHDISTDPSGAETVSAGVLNSSGNVQSPRNGNAIAEPQCESSLSAEKGGSGSTGACFVLTSTLIN